MELRKYNPMLVDHKIWRQRVEALTFAEVLQVKDAFYSQMSRAQKSIIDGIIWQEKQAQKNAEKLSSQIDGTGF